MTLVHHLDARLTAPLAALCALALPLLVPGCGDDSPSGSTDTATARGSGVDGARQDPVGPRIRLRLSGQLEGRLEPCGCASGQVGGLARRSFANQRDRGYDLLIEGGNLVHGGNFLDELKLLTTLNILDDKRTRYAAVGIGPDELELPVEVLADYLASFQLPFVSSDLVSATDATRHFPARRFVEREHEGVTVRIAALTGRAPEGETADEFGLELLAPRTAWKAAMDGAAPDTLRLLMVHGPDDLAVEAAGFTPTPDLVIAINGTHMEPPREASTVEGVPVVHPGIRGRFLLDVTLEREAGKPRITDYHAFPLKGSETQPGAMEDPDIKQLILDHRFEVKESGVREELAGQRPTANGAEYIGSASCAGCHVEAFQVWEKSKHAHAWTTLEEAEATGRYEWPVTHYPDCVACHTVGYGEVSGFTSPEATPLLRGVGCEQCHGAGSAHAANPQEAKLGDVAPERCQTCHDYEQSPDWDYAPRWKTIEHR